MDWNLTDKKVKYGYDLAKAELEKEKKRLKEEINVAKIIDRVCDDICMNYCKYEAQAFDAMEEDKILEVCDKCPLNLLR